MQEPTPHSSRLAMAGGLAALLLVGGGGFLIGRTTAPEPAPAVSAIPTPQPAPPPPPAAIAPPTLERAGLLDLVADAVDAVSASRPLPEAVQAAAGRRFDLALPFGCEGPVEGERTAPFGWQYDEAKTTLRVWINPVRWERATWGSAETGEGKAAFEGFWIAKPWSTATDCPATALSGAINTAPSGQTQSELAIARLVEADAGKSARRLDIVKRMEPGDFDPARGFTLRIIGRLQSAEAGRPVRCLQPTEQHQRPQCMIIGDFAELRVENPKTGDLLGVWPMSETSQRD
ncbi:hypothetical protein KC8_19095 [Sphingomonas sp. KC8]|nr:hypothetical protein KC8_19095 [Sphingomonas sp. KC8]